MNSSGIILIFFNLSLEVSGLLLAILNFCQDPWEIRGNLGDLAFEAADLWDKKIDFIILGSYFGLKLSVSLLKLCVLPWFCFAHYSTFLIESLYFAAQNDNFAGKFISKRFFTLKFLFIWFQSSLIALDISQ